MKAIKRIFFGGKTWEWEDDDWVKPIFKSLDETHDLQRKHLNKFELEDAKEKLLSVLIKDLKMPSGIAKQCVDHVLGIKAMYNAGYPREFMKKLLITNKLVQELHDTKVKLRHMGKQYARASDTIAELRGRLAQRLRNSVNTEMNGVLDRIEKIQQQLMEKK